MRQKWRRVFDKSMTFRIKPFRLESLIQPPRSWVTLVRILSLCKSVSSPLKEGNGCFFLSAWWGLCLSPSGDSQGGIIHDLGKYSTISLRGGGYCLLWEQLNGFSLNLEV